ncbi:hypothetical protein [Nonomuraea candida]|uniref:hypothetical protein n=1 Tax=Nonomuraea candida TaxID=359159 RepID=UPI0005BB279F|nr:hypothetical protein [Nonomuraea candida]
MDSEAERGAPPAERLIPAVLAASALEGGLGDVRAHAVPAPRRAWQLLVMEARLLHSGVWAASFLVVAVCAGFAAMRAAVPEVALGLSVPLVAGMGVAGLYGPERDHASEVVAATPTSPRVVLLARVTLVFGYDLALALLVSGALAVVDGSPGAVTGLVMAWLGPMALLAAVALLLSVWWRPDGAVGVALAAWCVPALAQLTAVPVPDGYRVLWQSGPWTFALAVVLAGAAVALAGRIEPMRRAAATHSA